MCFSHWGQGLSRDLDIRALNFGRHRFAAFQQGIAT